jgi:replicative DNA helicase
MANIDSKEKIPPHDAEIERSALGALLSDSDGGDAAAIAGQYLHSGDFYSFANNRIFEAIQALSQKNVRPDIQTVVQELRQLGKLDEAGGPDYIASLTDIIPSGANIEYYAKTVQNYSLRRSLLRLAGEIGAKVFDESLESDDLLEDVQRKIFELCDKRQAFDYKTVGEVLNDTIVKIEKVQKEKKKYTGVPSGFDQLDWYTSGFQPSEFIVIGARPSMGKTALALTMAANIAIKNKTPAAFFTLEMSDQALVQRLISSEAMIDSNNLRTGYLSIKDMQRILVASGKIFDAPLYLVDMPSMKLLDLRTQARRLRAKQNVEIIFIDYLGLIGSDNNNIPRYEQISEISRSLKSLARELNIPIVVLSQLTREAEKEKPNLSNLRDSGSVEQDADVVMLLHRERVNAKDKKEEVNTDPDGGLPTDLIIAKQRNGPVGLVKLMLKGKYNKFSAIASEYGDKK